MNDETVLVDDIRRLCAQTTIVVDDQHIDRDDHVAPHHYLLWAEEAVLVLCESLGMGPRFLAETARSLVTTEHHLRYVAEVRRGAKVATHVRLLERGRATLHMIAFVVDDLNDRLAATVELMVLNVSSSDRRPESFGEMPRGAIDSHVA